MTKLIKSDKRKAMSFHGLSRYIDDMLCLNDSDYFSKSFREIYPPNLQLKMEHCGAHGSFLDLGIEIENEKFHYKLFDKRDSFPFQIIRMPYYDSNIPFFTFYGTVFSEFLRIARCSSHVMDFIHRAHLLKTRMISQGGAESAVIKQIRKLNDRYPECLRKFGTPLNNLLNAVRCGVLVEDDVAGDS